jgi:hypothetical protein
MTGFPNARHDDQVDSVSQFLAWTASARVAVTLAREFNEGLKAPRPDPDDDEAEFLDRGWTRSGRPDDDVSQLLIERRWSHHRSGTPPAIIL